MYVYNILIAKMIEKVKFGATKQFFSKQKKSIIIPVITLRFNQLKQNKVCLFDVREILFNTIIL